MKRDIRCHARQEGVVLVIALLLLVVLTIIGVTTMSSTIMQERMAGAFKTQSEAFADASSGVSQALDYFYDVASQQESALGSRVNEFGQICGYLHGDENQDYEYGTGGWAWPDGGVDGNAFDSIGTDIQRRMYCCQNWVEVPLDEAGEDLFCQERQSQLFILSRGVRTSSNEQVALRNIEVRLDEAAPQDLDPAINIMGCVLPEKGPNAKNFLVDGGCNAAVGTDNDVAAGQITSLLEDNADGGIVPGDLDTPWNDPVALAEFVFWTKLGMDSANYYEGDFTFSGKGGTPPFGAPGNPQLTYFDGDLTLRGAISGNGIMIVRGELDFDGTPNFEGLFLTLGGGFAMGGGGGDGGNPAGAVVATNLVAGEPEDLLGREVLKYPVAEGVNAAGDPIVAMFDPDDYPLVAAAAAAATPSIAIPVRPILLSDNGAEIIYAGGDTYFSADGDKLTLAGVALQDASGDSVESLTPDPNNPPRDRFGRLIPDFVDIDNWPPESYGYNPNEWRWNPPNPQEIFGFNQADSPLSPPSPECTSLEFRGGGKGTFRADPRVLQTVRHQLLCEDKADPELPSNFDFENPDPTVCNHYIDGEPYNEDFSGQLNQLAWHIWRPRLRCLGIGGDADIIIAGWRENIGWRDDDDFVGCAAFTQEVRCPNVN